MPWGKRQFHDRAQLLVGELLSLRSGKRLHSYGKSPFLMGKSTINGHFQ